MTERLQLAPAASEVPQVLDCAKEAALMPVSVMPVRLSGALPVLESVTTCCGLVVRTFCENASDELLSVAAGAVPVPVREADCGEFAALSVMVSVAA